MHPRVGSTRGRRPYGLVARAALLALLAACDSGDPPADTGPGATVDTAAAQGTTPAQRPDTTPRDRATELRAAMAELVSGQRASPPAHSWFSAATADVVRSVDVDTAGHATISFVDLTQRIPNASSSAGSTALLEELNATVFGVNGIESVDYLIEGSCARFWEWLQYGCQRVHRDGTMTPRSAP